MIKKTIGLAGNPNVGKTTVFNALTGLHQHTGNWPGKTVANATGYMEYKDMIFEFADLPGAYSLSSSSPDEKITGDYILSGDADIILIVADATCLQRNLLLIRDILSITGNAVLCINLMDEAEKKGIHVDTSELERMLHIPVLPTAARSGHGLEHLIETLYSFEPCRAPVHICDTDCIYSQCVTNEHETPHAFDRRLDKIVTSRIFGYPVMLLLLALIFWLTMTGANYPSAALSSLFEFLEVRLRLFMQSAQFPAFLTSMLIDGLYSTLTWVVSVMLPPMAIFFPLFTLLEDFGYLPRIAFNLDNAFRRCGAHGKQALTMCMGLGCNACGVMGCRIIDSPRERLIAVITNSFIPCNGRFPTLIALIMIFFTTGFTVFRSLAAGFILAGIIMSGIIMTLFMSKVLSETVLKGISSSFILELPPYRMPKIGSVIIHSILDRTLFVLGRAVIIAAPAGIIIWLLANIYISNASALSYCTDFLDPLGHLLGLDGVILMAFILGFPANEIVIPIMLMCYMSTGTLTDYGDPEELRQILAASGWTKETALCMMTLCLFHFPCGTTCLTIKKETGSLKWTALAFLLPTAVGMLLCFIINIII